MEFEAALVYMQSLVRFGWKLGNERFTALCAGLGDPQNQYGIVHVAGTKGKGSTTALTAALLRESGLHVGSYFSPYVYDVRERVQVDGQPISREDFATLVTLARPHIEALAATEFGQVTEFELKTLIAFLHFAREHVHFGCIEVGIGGRLDATNIVVPSVSVITNIGLDHTQILGDTHELIAAEKAGIIKRGVPVITAAEHEGALGVITAVAERCEAPLIRVEHGNADVPTNSESQVKWSSVPPNADAGIRHNGPFRIATARNCYAIRAMAMRGQHQRTNAACAVAAAEIALSGNSGAELSAESVNRAMASTELPGRLTTIPLSNGRLIVLDGAHNQLAAESIRGPLEELRKEYDIRRTIVVLGMLTGHDPRPVAQAILPGAELVFACSPNWKRALPAHELEASIRGIGPTVVVIPDVREAAQAALDASRPGDMVLITGSFYTVGETPREWILSDGRDERRG